MRRLFLIAAALIAACGSVLVTVAGADDTHTYQVELDNAFGVVEGSDIRVAGVNVGSVTDLEINFEKRAVVSFTTTGELGELGVDTVCSSEPQSLIAEYFLDCQPEGETMPDAGEIDPNAPCETDNGCIPVDQTTQTVQQDLVQNTMREPFKQRLALLINEFGTALAGNAENLNEAIRRGAPALRELEEVLRILGSQNRIIRDLNADSDQIITALAERRDDVVRFIQEANETAEISASVRDDLSRDFELLPTFLAELEPTLAELEQVAVDQTPVLADLFTAAPDLTALSENLIPFNEATALSLDSLGEASVIGTRALDSGEGVIRQLSESVENAPAATEPLVDLLRDLDDPGRAVQYDDWAARDTGRKDPTGYTGLEGLLNYVYYQAGTLNQFDGVSHFLHFSLYDVFTGPCGQFFTGRDAQSGAPGVPAEDGGMTTDFLEADTCTAWLGPNQPGINQNVNLPPYDPSVCPHGTEPEAALALCDPAGTASAETSTTASTGGTPSTGGTTPTPDETAPPDDGGDEPTEPDIPLPETTLPGDPQDILDSLEDLLGLPEDALPTLPQLGGGLSGPNSNTNGGGNGSSGENAAQDLLEFLFVD